jgi:hypothetical protein
MKISLSLIGIMFTLIACKKKAKTDQSTLQKVAIKLDSIKRVSYRYRLEINIFKDNGFFKDSSDCYFEFNQQSEFMSRLLLVPTTAAKMLTFFLNAKNQHTKCHITDKNWPRNWV